jgi:hypothetical protein
LAGAIDRAGWHVGQKRVGQRKDVRHHLFEREMTNKSESQSSVQENYPAAFGQYRKYYALWATEKGTSLINNQ